MNNSNLTSPHPGSYVKEILKKKKLTAVKAAEIIGIGRPALTNFLNGKADLSKEMAARLEKAFDIKKSELLQMQLEFDNDKISQYEKELQLNRYVTGNLEIRASDIELWSEKHESRAELAVLVRKLINSTGINLVKVDFPAYENSELPGWDGELESESATQKIPLGKSGWELGVGKEPQVKANKDYKSRTEGIPSKERKNLTFVFVTPRNWKDKKKWEESKKNLKEWKDVRAYDASDLEQWIDQSTATQTWFLEKIKLDDKGFWSLEGCWKKWALNTKPELNKTLFKEAVETHKRDFLSWLKNNPPAKPFLITSDSHEEALAFLACMFDHVDGIFSDKTIVVKSPEALRKLMAINSKEIVIISSSDAEKEILSGYQNSVHTIIIRHKNELKDRGEASITLDMPSYNAFKSSLKEMGMDDDAVNRHIKNSGSSPTILRRRLSNVPAEQYPECFKDENVIRNLIPITLAGSWDKDREADKEIIRELFGADKNEVVERAITDLCKKDTTLLWTIGKKIGVKSKIENLFLIKDSITESDLDKFFTVAINVLSEEDPALELPEEKRWMAGVYNKIRNHSGYLREGICETLVLLSVNGNPWFQDRLGIDVQVRVNEVIRNLLKPFKQNTWFSQKNDLPKYAEAAPEEFLKIIEEDLSSDSPEILSLLKPEKGGIFGGCPRASLLWALELLAWNPQNLWRAVKILAQLAQHKIDDNYSNKPIKSLENIFKSWIPQTSANLEQRKKILSELIKKFPSVGWEICMEQFHVGQSVCSPSSRPRWRNDASGSGHGVSNHERYDFVREAVDKALGWEKHDEKSLGGLLERLQVISNEDSARLWNLISDWNSANPTDQQKSKLREYLRRYALSRHRNGHLSEDNRKNANIAYASLEPKDLLWKHHWLFAETWVTESISEIDDENYSYEKRDKQIEQLRIAALSEIWKERNSLGIIQLLSQSNACVYIGFYLRKILSQSEILPLFDKLFLEEIEVKNDQFIAGFFGQSKEGDEVVTMAELITHYIKSGEEDKIIKIVKNAPLRNETWQIVLNLSEELQKRYWSETDVRSYGLKEEELKELIDRLIWVNRPKFAISIIGFPQVLKNVNSEQLAILLKEMATNASESWQKYQIQSYTIEDIFKTLSERGDIPEDRLAGLEFLYIKTLEHTSYGIPNLEKNVTKFPQLFMQALALAFRRRDHRDDSKKWVGENAENNEVIASTAYSLLSNVKLLPGTENGIIDENNLKNWVEEVRKLCAENNREDIGDQYIGQFLSKAPIGEDGVWPCKPVRNVLEYFKSEQIARGLSIGVYNSRGVVCRGTGGDQERELLIKYKNWAQALEYDHPYVSQILNSIADNYENDAKRWDENEKLKRHIDL